MAELKLTEAEKAADLWTDLDDASLGRLLRKKLAGFTNAAAQMDRTDATVAALFLCCDAAANDATEVHVEFTDVTQAGRHFGDWKVVVSKRVHPVTFRAKALETAAAAIALLRAVLARPIN